MSHTSFNPAFAQTLPALKQVYGVFTILPKSWAHKKTGLGGGGRGEDNPSPGMSDVVLKSSQDYNIIAQERNTRKGNFESFGNLGIAYRDLFQ